MARSSIVRLVRWHGAVQLPGAVNGLTARQIRDAPRGHLPALRIARRRARVRGDARFDQGRGARRRARGSSDADAIRAVRLLGIYAGRPVGVPWPLVSVLGQYLVSTHDDTCAYMRAGDIDQSTMTMYCMSVHSTVSHCLSLYVTHYDTNSVLTVTELTVTVVSKQYSKICLTYVAPSPTATYRCFAAPVSFSRKKSPRRTARPARSANSIAPPPVLSSIHYVQLYRPVRSIQCNSNIPSANCAPPKVQCNLAAHRVHESSRTCVACRVGSQASHSLAPHPAHHLSLGDVLSPFFSRHDRGPTAYAAMPPPHITPRGSSTGIWVGQSPCPPDASAGKGLTRAEPLRTRGTRRNGTPSALEAIDWRRAKEEGAGAISTSQSPTRQRRSMNWTQTACSFTSVPFT